MLKSNTDRLCNVKSQFTLHNPGTISGGLYSFITILILNLLSCGYLPLEEKQEEQITQGVEVTGRLSNGEEAKITVQVFPKANHQELVAEGEGDESISLDVGDYDILVIYCGTEVWLNDIEVTAGEWAHREIILECGTIILHPQDKEGKKVWAFIRVYPPGNHLKSVSTAWGEEPIYLPPANYDLLVKHKKAELWLSGVKVIKDQIVEKEIRFGSEIKSN